MRSSQKGQGVVPARNAAKLLLGGSGWTGMATDGVVKLGPLDDHLELPQDLSAEALDLSDCTGLKHLPAGLRAYELHLSQTAIRTVPPDLHVDTILNLSNCRKLASLPRGLTVGSLILRGCTSLESLPEELDCWFLDLTGCWAFRNWPKHATIRSGRLNLRGCTAVSFLPEYLGPLAAVNLRDCPNIRGLPSRLRITGWIDIAQSGLAAARATPPCLKAVEIRWQGVPIDERIWFRPESITVDEILTEENVERRRVLLDRFGYSRFMEEAKAELLDKDNDAGGERQLLRVPLTDDEPLVTLSCFCPSTRRQYFLRVPPETETCHQAAAWIAGFDDPDQYHPLIET
jgi:hypothetical protein